MEDANYSFRQIGIVRSSLREVRDAPNQAFEGAPEALLEIDPTFAPALHRVTAGQDLILLTWLHRADRSVLQTHPRGDPNTPLTGVFATRSSERPNPIGLHRVTITAIESPTLLRASSLEAIDGTPIASPSLVHSSAVDHAANPRETALVPPAENKALIRRFYEEAWDQGKLDVIDDVFADDYVRHDLRATQAAPGPEGQNESPPTSAPPSPTCASGRDHARRGRVRRRTLDRDGNPQRTLGARSGRPAAAPHSPASTSSASRTGESPRSGTTATTSACSSSSAHRSTPALLQKTDGVALGLAARVPTGRSARAPSSLGHRVAISMSDRPLAALAAIDLGHAQAVTARLPVHRSRGVLETGRISQWPTTSYACSSNSYNVQSEKLSASGVKSSSSSSCPRALRHAPRTLTGSFRDQSARRGAASPLCRAGSTS